MVHFSWNELWRVAIDDPHRVRPGLGGMTAYAPKAIAVVCIMMEAERKTYRKMIGHLRGNRDIAMKTRLHRFRGTNRALCRCGTLALSALQVLSTRL